MKIMTPALTGMRRFEMRLATVLTSLHAADVHTWQQ